jgi:hypothetical protein
MKSSLLTIINDPSGVLILKLTFNLTVTARNAYIIHEDGVDRPEILRGINELQHRLLGRVLAMNSDRYLAASVEFADKLYAISELYSCIAEFETAIQFTLAK